MKLTGRTVLLTGAAGGIGEATARRLASVGSRLILVDVDRERLGRLGQEIGAADVAAPADVTNLAEMEEAVSVAPGERRSHARTPWRSGHHS